MKILSSKTKTLEIQLVEPEVYMRGTPHRGYSSGQVRGVVKLQLSTQKRALSLKLTLVGTIQTNWATEGRVCREQMEVLRQEWSFDTSHRKNDVEFFPFQEVLPSTLPPSTTVRGGRVKYWLEAQLVRPRRWDTRVGRELLVLRVESPTSSVLSEGVYASGSFKGLFDYQLSCPHRTFGPGDQVPVRFQLTTKDVGVDIKMISALIKRTTTLRTIKNQLTKQKEDVVDINHCALNHPSQVDETIILNPSCHKSIWNSQNFVSDTSNLLMRVRHEIKARVAFQDSAGRCCDMILKFSITLMPIDREKVLVGLPTYSKHSNTLLLDADCQPPIYRATWCPLSTKPSIASLPAYEHRYHQSLRHIPPRKSSRPHLARVPILY